MRCLHPDVLAVRRGRRPSSGVASRLRARAERAATGRRLGRFDSEKQVFCAARPPACLPRATAATERAEREIDARVDPSMRDTLFRSERVARVREALSRRLGSLVVVCEAVRRRHNVSAILRTCEAFGVHEVHLITANFRPSPGAARGAERWVFKKRFDTVDASLAELQGRGFDIYVADLAEQADSPATVPVDRPLAIVFGSEAQGVSDEARRWAKGVVQVPMFGLTESLNVSVSAAVMIHQLAERKRALFGNDLSPEAQQAFVDEWYAAEELAVRGKLARATVEPVAE